MIGDEIIVSIGEKNDKKEKIKIKENTSLYGVIGEVLEITLDTKEFNNNINAMLVPEQSTGICNEFASATEFSIVENTAYVLDGCWLMIIDISNSSQPVIIASYYHEEYSSIQARGHSLFIATPESIKVFDSTNPKKINLLGEAEIIYEDFDWRRIPRRIQNIVTVVSNTAILKSVHRSIGSCCHVINDNEFIDNDYDGIHDNEICSGGFAHFNALELFDISNPSKPRHVNSVQMFESPEVFDYCHCDNTIIDKFFLSSKEDIAILNLQHDHKSSVLRIMDMNLNPANPLALLKDYFVKIDNYECTFQIFEIFNDNAFYIANGYNGIQVNCYNDTTTNFEIPGCVSDVKQNEEISYVAGDDLTIIDSSTPLKPIIIGQVEIPGQAKKIAVNNDNIYVLSKNCIAITGEPIQAHIISYTNFQITLNVPSPKNHGTYQLKIYNSEINKSIPINYHPFIKISNIEDQTVSSSRMHATFPFTITPTLQSKNESYTITGQSGIPFLIPDDHIAIEGDDLKHKINIKIPIHQNGLIPIHIKVNSASASSMQSFSLTIKPSQFVYKSEEPLSLTLPQITTVSQNNHIYEVRTFDNCIIKKNFENEEISRWGQQGIENGSFNEPTGIAIDSGGYIYVADSENHRIQVFTIYGEFVTSFGEYGRGQLYTPTNISIDENDTIYVSEENSNHVKVFQKFDYTEGITKAIILAGGGPYDGNTIWSATKSCANLAYRALVYQGLNNNMIHYLSSEPETENHHVDDKATIENLKNAITQWTAGVDIADHDEALTTCADSLVIYLVDHGGDGVFRVNESEILSATVLNQWLDQIQEIIPGKLIVIYDACHSGSFMPVLSSIPDNRERIVITSTLASETAKFIGNGAISFSHYFWASILNGQDIKNAFISAQNINNFKFNDVSIFDQEPQININGNTMSNEPIDINGLQNVLIGNGKDSLTDLPVIQNISPEKTITNASSADITATGVWAQEGISSVWAQIIPENYRQTDTQKPLIALASVELHYSETTKGYIGTYDEFTHEGSYIIVVYVKDMKGIVSYPKLTKLNVQKPSKRRAIIIMGETTPDSYTAINETCKLAANSLKAQAYFDDDIIMLSGKTESVNRVRSEISQCIDVQDVTLYMIGNLDSRDFIFNQTEIILKEDINEWLNEINHNVPIIVIYDAPYASDYLSGLIPVDNRNRILISSTSNEKVYYFMDGSLSFSRYFWNMISNGETLYNSYFDAYNAVQTICYRRQRPQIIHGKQLSQRYGLGFAIMFGYDNPIISSVTSKQTLQSENSADIVANNVTTTRSIKKVVAIIKPPEYRTQQNNLQEIELLNISGTNNYSSTYTNFVMPGLYEMAISAIDTFGNISSPLTTTVTKHFQLYDIISGLQRMAGLDVTTKNLTYFDLHVDQFSLKDIIYMMQGLLDERDDP
jgi:hypothetical protein